MQKSLSKIVLAAAVAAGVSMGAQAVQVKSDITAINLIAGTNDVLADPQSMVNVWEIGGSTVTGLTMTADFSFYAGGAFIYIDMQLTDGMRQGVNGAGGTIFEGGYMAISASTDGGSTIFPYDTIDASVTPMPFLAGSPDHYGGIGPTVGLVVDDNGNAILPGLFSISEYFSGSFNEVGYFELFDVQWGIFLEGTVSPVPIPAAAWLFGSALLGVVGLKRRRPTAL